MCTLTTTQGVKWEIIELNGRSAYQSGDILCFWNPLVEQYMLVDGMLQIAMSGTLQECLECVIDFRVYRNVRERAVA